MAAKSAKTLMLAATHRCSSDKVVLMTFASSLRRITALVFKGDQRGGATNRVGLMVVNGENRCIGVNGLYTRLEEETFPTL